MTEFTEKLIKYFQNRSEAIASEKDSSEIFEHKGDAGDTRESILIQFLKKHCPKRCEVLKGGFIFDEHGNKSNQIDILITNDCTLQFRDFDDGDGKGKAFNCIDGTYCAISVKTKLDKDALIDSIENFRSIPNLGKVVINTTIGKPSRLQELPFNIIFAYDGLEQKTIVNHINEYYQQNSVPENRKIDFVVVNNKYSIFKIDERTKGSDGNSIEANSYYSVSKGAYVGGYALLSLLTHIQRIAIYGSQLLFDFGKYSNQVIHKLVEINEEEKNK